MARILIIDDNETMREGLGATVRRMGHEAVMASSGAEGLTHVAPAAGRPPVEFVITDLKMDGIGGLDVVKAVRERDPDCPVMIVTAFGTVETAVEAMRLGAWDFLQQPFAPEVVIPAIHAMHKQYGRHIYGKYGFVDAFNPSFDYDVPLKHGRRVRGVGWVGDEYLGIDQGPIISMIENHRSELIWSVMKRNQYIQRGLRRASFEGGWLG